MDSPKRELRNRFRVRRRLLLSGRSAVYHVMSRIVRRQFWLDDGAREVFVRMLRKQAAFTGVEVLTYCVMGNHFHLLVRVPECPLREKGDHLISDAEILRRYEGFYGESRPISAWSVDELREILEGSDLVEAEFERRRVLSRMGNLSAFMQELKHRFSVWFNAKHDNQGTIWSARFKSLLVEDAPEVLTKVGAYVDLNPVRAEIVDDPAKYRWCGYGEAIAGEDIARDGLCGLYGANVTPDYKRAIAAYRLVLFGKGGQSKGVEGKDRGRIEPEAVAQVLQNGGEVSLDEALRCRIRYFSDGLALGGREFVERCFAENRDLFGSNRKTGGAPLKGAIWDGMCVSRNLCRRVFG